MVKNLLVNDFGFNLNKKLVHSFTNKVRKFLELNFESLTINFITSDQILEINKKYLNHNYYTDIITFNYSGNHKLIDGEIFISFETAIQNAKKYKVDIMKEIGRLIIHGILHLIGMDDKKKHEKIIMKKKENELLKMYNFILLQQNEIQ